MGDNGNGGIGKICPFLDKPCIGTECALLIQLSKQVKNKLGVPVMVTANGCALPVNVELLSQVSQILKKQAQSQGEPKLYSG